MSTDRFESESSATSGGAFGVDLGAADTFLGMLEPATLALMMEGGSREARFDID